MISTKQVGVAAYVQAHGCSLLCLSQHTPGIFVNIRSRGGQEEYHRVMENNEKSAVH
jgi:hypothetical protein